MEGQSNVSNNQLHVTSKFASDLAYSNRLGVDSLWLERHKEYFKDNGLKIVSTNFDSRGNDYGVDMVVYSPKAGRAYKIEHKEHLDTKYHADRIQEHR
ncbi:hypothetical protein HW44_10135 [Nitrosococcus oceani]|nr:hypothetical protein HW44_10135 [Nitrosococcus oceani]